MSQPAVTRILSVLALAALLAGCGSTPATRFYLLAASGSSAPSGERPAIGISTLDVADYLLAPQLLTTDGANRVHRAEFERWAEPLDEGVARVFAQELGVRLDTQAVRAAPWPRDWLPDWELRLRVERLDAGPADATLLASWSLQDGARANPARDRVTRLAMPRSGTGPDATAADFSALLGQLAARVAAEVTALSAGDAGAQTD